VPEDHDISIRTTDEVSLAFDNYPKYGADKAGDNDLECVRCAKNHYFYGKSAIFVDFPGYSLGCHQPMAASVTTCWRSKHNEPRRTARHFATF